MAAIPIWLSSLILVIAALFGAGMGSLIHTFQIPAFIVTLAGMFLARGLCFVLTDESIPINAPLYGQITDIAFSLPGGGRLTFIAMVMLADRVAPASCWRISRASAPMSMRSAATGRRRS